MLDAFRKGSATSGHHRHLGRPGSVGGSKPSDNDADYGPENKFPKKPSREEYKARLEAARRKGVNEAKMLLLQARAFWNASSQSVREQALGEVRANKELASRDWDSLPTSVQKAIGNRYFRP